jgi:hypothetical protein
MAAFKVFPGFLSNVLVAVVVRGKIDGEPKVPAKAADFGK